MAIAMALRNYGDDGKYVCDDVGGYNRDDYNVVDDDDGGWWWYRQELDDDDGGWWWYGQG